MIAVGKKGGGTPLGSSSSCLLGPQRKSAGRWRSRGHTSRTRRRSPTALPSPVRMNDAQLSVIGEP